MMRCKRLAAAQKFVCVGCDMYIPIPTPVNCHLSVQFNLHFTSVYLYIFLSIVCSISHIQLSFQLSFQFIVFVYLYIFISIVCSISHILYSTIVASIHDFFQRSVLCVAQRFSERGPVKNKHLHLSASPCMSQEPFNMHDQHVRHLVCLSHFPVVSFCQVLPCEIRYMHKMLFVFKCIANSLIHVPAPGIRMATSPITNMANSPIAIFVFERTQLSLPASNFFIFLQ